MTTKATRARRLRWIVLLAALLILLTIALWVNARMTRELQSAVAGSDGPAAGVTSSVDIPPAREPAREDDASLATLATPAAQQSPARWLSIVLFETSGGDGSKRSSLSDPLEGVSVRLVELDRHQPYLNTRVTETNGGGVAHFENVPAGSLRVFGLGVRLGQLEYTEHSEGPVLFGVKLRSLACVVRDEQDAPIEGAALCYAYQNLPPGCWGSTRSDGTSPETRMAVGARVFAMAPGFASSASQLVADTSSELRFTLAREHGGLRGVVQDPRGATLAGVRIQARGKPSSPTEASHVVHSDLQGRFAMEGLSPGVYEVIAADVEHAAHLSEARVEAGYTSDLVLTLKRGAMVRGSISDARGEPVSGVSVNVGRFGDWWTASTSSTADGAYELANVTPGAVTISAESASHGRAQAALKLVDGTTHTWNPQLDNGRVLRGTVMNPDREPLANWSVARVESTSPTMLLWKTTSAGDGSFELGRCPQDGSFSVAFSKPGPVIEPFVVQFDPRDERIEVVVPWEWIPEGQLSFALHTPDGALAVGARCTVQYADRPGRSVTCRIEREGDIMRVDGLRSGEFDLRFEYEGCGPIFIRDLVLAPKESRHLGLLQFEQGAWLRVEHVDDEGKPVHRASVLTHADGPRIPDDEPGRLGAKHVAQGFTFEFGPLAPGKYHLETGLGSQRHSETTCSLAAGDRVSVRIAPPAEPDATPK